MAKRFIDTNFFKSPFVRGLEGSLKALYCFIICDCSGAGIWSVDFEIASMYIGHKISKKDADVFLTTGKAIDLGDGKWFFPDFLEHQYPKGLQRGNMAHKNFISELLKYKLLDENLKPLSRPFKGAKVMVMVKDMVKVKEEGNGNGKIFDAEIFPAFEDFWNLYDKKTGLEKSEALWEKISQPDREKIMQHIPSYKIAEPDKKFRKNPETYLRNKSWNDEIIQSNDKSNSKTGSEKFKREDVVAGHAKHFSSKQQGANSNASG